MKPLSPDISRSFTSRRMWIAFVLLLGAIGAGGAYSFIHLRQSQSSLRQQQAEVYPPFRWDEFLPKRKVRATPIDWAQMTDDPPNDIYERLRRQIVANASMPNDIEGFRLIIRDEPTLARIESCLARLDGPDHNRAVRELYETMMYAPANPDVLLSHLTEHSNKMLGLAAENVNDNGRHFGWGLSIDCYAALNAYEATEDARFLDLAENILRQTLQHRDSEIGRIDEARGRIMHSWGGDRYDPTGRYSTNITLGGRVSFNLCRFADIVRRDDALGERYNASADQFVEAARLCIDDYDAEFHVIEDGQMGYYEYITAGEIEPHNHIAWTGNALILLHELTGEEKYRVKAEQLARFTRSCMRIDEKGCLIWNYQATPEERFGEKVEWLWKARTTAQYIIFAHEHAVVFTSEDVDALANTLLTHVFRDDGRVSARIDGPFVDMRKYADFRGNYLATTPFIVLEKYRPEVRHRIEELVATRPDIGGWLRSTHGSVAYSYLLRDSKRNDEATELPGTARDDIKHIREEFEIVTSPVGE